MGIVVVFKIVFTVEVGGPTDVRGIRVLGLLLLVVLLLLLLLLLLLVFLVLLLLCSVLCVVTDIG